MAKDLYHNNVREALQKDGWAITNDPLRLNAPGEKRLLADLGGSKILGASQGTKKIAVEIKGFQRPSILYDFHAALGQYLIY
ncbi:MAG: element excision factor XisH family protein [Saprospiraceae bacterium]